MSISTIITLIAAVASSSVLAAIVTAIVNSKRNKAQSETEARAQFSAEFDVLAKNLSDEIKRQDTKIEHQDTRIETLTETVVAQGGKITRLERQEWSLRRYISVLIAFIRQNDLDPPEPQYDLDLDL